jgi:AraC-like DNA-binding protein
VEYREYAPPPELRELVQCLWTMEGHADELGTGLQPVLPDGRPELILHLGDAFERVDADGAIARQAHMLFAGQLTSQLVLKPTARIAVAAVRFRPDGAAGLLKIPQACLAGLTMPVQDVSPSLHASLAEVGSETNCPGLAVALILQRLVPRLATFRSDRRIRYVVGQIASRRGIVSVDHLARQIGMSRRNLERRFNVVVGMSPKRLARIARFQYAVSMLEQVDERQRGIRTAAECGYADQAHFIRDFRELAGCAPGAHILTRGELTGFFTERLSPIQPDQ